MVMHNHVVYGPCAMCGNRASHSGKPKYSASKSKQKKTIIFVCSRSCWNSLLSLGSVESMVNKQLIRTAITIKEGNAMAHVQIKKAKRVHEEIAESMWKLSLIVLAEHNVQNTGDITEEIWKQILNSCAELVYASNPNFSDEIPF